VVARRSGLGKGLGALIPTEARDRDSALRVVPMTSIKPNPLQPRTRFDEEAMSNLASSIREVGVLQPILVRETGDGEYELIAGERRWRAARRAGLQTIPVLVQSVSDVHSLEQALVENLHREDLNPLEEAGAFQQLVDEFGYTHEQVASRVGKSRTAVTNTLRLLQLPAGVQRSLADGAISAGHARALLGTPDRSFQEELAKRIVSEGLTVRAVEEGVRRHASGAEPTAAPDENGSHVTSVPAPSDTAHSGSSGPAVRRRLPAPGVLELEDLLSHYLNTRVKVEMGAKRGRVAIDFATLEDLERIYKLMVGGVTA
jgi:ParB family transcriptional regulator, chromosome partitioning protein